MSAVARIVQRLRAFRRNEEGTASVEAVLWFPLFGMLSSLLVDATVLFHGEAEIHRIVHDTNRRVSINSLQSQSDAVAFATSRLKSLGIKPKEVQVSIDSNGNYVATLVKVEAKTLQKFGTFSALMNLEIEVASVHLLDTFDPATYAGVPTFH